MEVICVFLNMYICEQRKNVLVVLMFEQRHKEECQTSKTIKC